MSRRSPSLVKAVAADPDPPARLITGAERIAQSIPSMGSKASALGAIAKAPASPRGGQPVACQDSVIEGIGAGERRGEVAATDPDRAERIAQSITLETYKPMALVMVAEAVAATDPDQAARLAADAERIAQSIYFKDSEALALVMMAAATADSDRAARLAADAERIAQSIPDKGSKAMALASVAAVVAAADPDRAERIATSIPSLGWKAMALVMVAEAVAATDPERAALLITYADRVPRSSAFKSLLVRIAKFYAVDDPDYAERIALSITPDIAKISALVEIAETLSKS